MVKFALVLAGTGVMISILSSCFLFKEKNDKLTLEQAVLRQSKIRIDGFYYCPVTPDSGAMVLVYFFYRNGAVLHPGAVETIDEVIRTQGIENSYKEMDCVPSAWGLFLVNGDSIAIEMLHPGSGRYHAHIQKGVVTSDTTFVINSIVNSYFGDRSPRSDVFRFVKLPEKPDSVTDVFMLHQDCE